MYGFNENQVKAPVNAFPVAVNVDNVEITDCKYSNGTDKFGKAWESVDVVYTRDGASITDRMFKVDESAVSARSYIPNDTKEAAVEDRIKNLNTQLKHIADQVGVPIEELRQCRTGPKDTWADFAQDFSALVKKYAPGVKLYCKTTKNKNGYTIVARSTGNVSPFIQRMDKGMCTLEYKGKEAPENMEAPKSGVSGASAYLPKDSSKI